MERQLQKHCLVLDGVYRRTEDEPVFQQARAPSRDELAGLLQIRVGWVELVGRIELLRAFVQTVLPHQHKRLAWRDSEFTLASGIALRKRDNSALSALGAANALPSSTTLFAK